MRHGVAAIVWPFAGLTTCSRYQISLSVGRAKIIFISYAQPYRVFHT